ncbi:unnamed protein product [Lactuca virosa]|uniref:NB-ARC domain-containing protein n=1 Tax=Lactuca virosa TaxID=75947 RepID=A0AAU9M0P2_9ASTR|nr:unnamed protein product [Lactuca virosa]
MAVATDRLLKRLERLRTKSNHMINDVSLDNEHTPFIASPSFKILCKKAMSVCIIDPLWRIVHLSVPELIKFLHEEEGYTCLNVYWLKSLPKILYELQTVLDCVSDSRNWGILDRHVWDEVNKDEEVLGMLKKIKGTLSDYFPVLIDETPRVSCAIEELKTVIDAILILCCEFLDSDVKFVVFDDISRRKLESGFTQRQLELLPVPLKQSVDEEKTVVGFEDDTIKLLDKLTGFSKKLEVIPIIGMAGLGKTTLAKTRTEGSKYLVIFDDIWDDSHWKELKQYFPDDRNGSRILLTTRNSNLGSTTAHSHRLRLRTARESWRILQMMVFKNGKCPWRLYDIGKQISRKCCGLPLAVSITAGLLRGKWTRASWKEVAESLSNYIVNDPNQYMDTLALSYNHLPPHLRPCFLYLGAFPGDCDIPVHKLIWLWVAQGFIHQTGSGSGSKTLEDVAEGYLMDLLGRSLVIVSKKGVDGQIKACHVHDLLRSLCLWKANEEGFSPVVYRVLDIESTSIFSFPREVLQLVNLRYLAIQAEDGNPPTSISNLVHLQILIISSRKNVFIPRSTWDMECLRHLYIKSGEKENLIEDVDVYSDRVLENLQTISGVCPSTSCVGILSRTPNLRKLGFHGSLVSPLGVLEFPRIFSLTCLQTLKLSNTKMYHSSVKSCSLLMFPESLTWLTLSDIGLNWNEIQTIGLLPNLDVLKLNVNACIGEIWGTSDTGLGFRNLKLLKLQDLDLVKWEASSGDFPRLQRLVVRGCSRLEEIPACIGEILTLELIEVSWCSESTAQSARRIQKEQERNGNDFLKVFTSVHRDQQGKRKRPSHD